MQGKSGKVDVTIYREGYGGVRIPAELLSDDGVEVTGDEGVTTSNTMAGNFSTPNGTYEEPTVAFTVILPNAKYLKSIYPDLHTDSTDRPTIAGQTIFGGNNCTVKEPAKLVVHWTCDGNSDNDEYYPEVVLSSNFTHSVVPGDVLKIPITAYIHPSEELNGGLVAWGTGNLTEETQFSVENGVYEPIGS